MSKSHRSLCVSFSTTAAGLSIYHFFVWSNLNFLHISQWITLPTQSFVVLYYFCALFVRVWKGCVGLYCERELETEHNWNILTPNLWPSRCVFLVLLMLGSTLLGTGFLYWILSASSLDQSPGLVWLSLPHRPSTGTRTQLYWNCPCRTQLPTSCNSTGNSPQLARRTQLSYIVVRRPLDLWNRMFNRHQAEITVMQFRGHSLPVHQFMSVPWEFLARPISLAYFRPRDFLA